MPRGGRRRRGKKSRGRPVGERQGAHRDQKATQPVQDIPGGGVGRRRRRRRRVGRESGVASMIQRPAKLQTLPPDGVVLEELISNLQDEYGTPVTPQEYRLTIKMTPADEAAGSQVESEEGGSTGGRLNGIRRRRRRSRAGGAEVTQITAEPKDPEDPQEIPPT